ncbi:MAG: zinc/iron-chelating domain-containing protein [Desulfuromonas sp.]|uniref:YkgJ family cysteine cluster protein n=1 Tax=Desulfuromonas sp. TaxID=892 RepID=UPI000CC7DD8A|nr:YkgJ family cysteine cluster protein [Desulfuromonas sp.]PLX83970.1 MAG: zinc/iron-chelating domain-containing protein [Desulfuromonas sp.]
MEEILLRYRTLLSDIDAWFGRCQSRYPEKIACGPGCSACCRALFDITLLDAALLQQGFRQLEERTRREVLKRAQPILARLQARWPGFEHPYLLNALPEEEWEVPGEDETVCPLLGADGRCLVYAHRPTTCRLHGLPNIDLSGEVFSDGCCTRNFPGGVPLSEEGLRWEFRRAFAAEYDLLGAFTRELFGRPLLELDTLIPAALFIDFSRLPSADSLPRRKV